MLRPYDLLENILIDIEGGIRKGINSDSLAKKHSLSHRHLQRLDLFDNPIGYLTSPAVFQAKALRNRVFSGSCSETGGFRTTLLFKLAFKQSLTDYIRSRKIVESINDLLKTDTRLIDVAIGYGFGYEQTYIRAFKREFGMKPGEFRRAGNFAKAKLPIHLFDEHRFPDGLFMVNFLNRVLL